MALTLVINDGTGYQSADITTGLEGIADNAGVGDLRGGQLLVTQNGTPDKSVNVAAGIGYVANSGYSAGNGNIRFWPLRVGSTENVTIPDNATGNPRIDRICLKVDTGATPGARGVDAASVVCVTGTAAASPTAPAVPNDHLSLAQIAVANGFSSIVTANITDEREQVRVRPEAVSDSAWMAANETWTYSSWTSATRTAVVTVPSDATDRYAQGMKVRFVQPTDGTKYGIIQKVASTALTIFMQSGTDLDNEAITSPFFSTAHAPIGFSLDTDDWAYTLITSSSSDLTASPTINVWTNPGTNSGTVPIGLWSIMYDFVLTGTRQRTATTAAGPDTFATLSTANNSESSSSHTVFGNGNSLGGLSSAAYTTTHYTYIRSRLESTLGVTSATTYYLNARSTSSDTLSNVGFRGDIKPTKVTLLPPGL